ncbi:uncharacterized protein LOC143300594 [Babylonia areolata]|uniref:uncharacterized protein LOC143300594 n=1 Tax=Babylonia areolata TaxID=304850 RepID=UPI003FD5FAF4
MFNLPVISSSSRHSPESCGMMHLNALNGSCDSDSSCLSASAGPPSFEDSLTGGPLFGLFSMNGGDSSCHYSHHNHHNHHSHHHQSSTPSSQSSSAVSGYCRVRDRSPGCYVRGNLPSVCVVQQPPPHPPPVYKEHLSPSRRRETGSDVTMPAANERPGSRRRGSVGLVVESFEMEEQCGRLSQISLAGGSAPLHSSLPLPKSPRLGSSSRSKSHKETLTPNRKSGNGGWQKHSGSEKSALASAKDRLYRVFSPMFSRKQERRAETPTKDGSRKKGMPSRSAGNESSEEEDAVSHPARGARLPSGRAGSPHPDQFDDLGWGNNDKARRGKLHPNPHHHHHHHHQPSKQEKRGAKEGQRAK